MLINSYTIDTTPSNKGQGLVEYALVVVLVSVACIGALQVLGTNIDDSYSQISNSVSTIETAGRSGSGGGSVQLPNSSS